MRKVEIYTGAYASGKSENAINRAIFYAGQNKPITLVDLDTVEPAYCMRAIEGTIRSFGINLILQSDYFGLGEAGSYVTNEQINCLKTADNDIIIDIGYGASGLDTLDIVTDIEKEKDIRIYLVVNCAKFETKDCESILEYINFNSGENKKHWKKIHAFISNTHLGDETTKDDVIRGYNILKEVSEKISVPIEAISIDKKLKNDFKSHYDSIPIRVLDRYMPEALW